jgi:pilus assembly protein CpaE
MFASLNIQIDVHDPCFGKFITDEFENEPEITVSACRDLEPNIFFLEDAEGNDQFLKKLSTLRQELPKVGIFVISSNSSPDHIVEVMKAGADEYFMKPVSPQKIREAVARVQLKLLDGGKRTAGKAFAFLGSKGGLGTSVLSVNTTSALASRKSGRCALIDLDLQAGDSSVLLDVVPKTTISDVIRNYQRLDAGFLMGVMEKTENGFDLLAAPTSPNECSDVTGEHVRKILWLSRNLYETVIVDCPAMDVDERTLEVLRATNKTFIVTDLSVPAVRNASRLLKHLRQAGIGRAEVVVSRYIKGQAATLDQVEKTLGCRIYWLFPNDFESTMGSINRGTPLMKYDPRSALARSIAEFVQKLLDPAAFPHYRGAKGLLGKAV